MGPDGADVILDPVGGDYSEAALRSIAWQGRFLVVGFPAGIARLPLNLTLLKSCDVAGVFWGRVADRYGTRPVVLLGVVAAVVVAFCSLTHPAWLRAASRARADVWS